MDALTAVAFETPVFVLCHNPVESSDHIACGTPGTKARLGDLRYHAINIVKSG